MCLRLVFPDEERNPVRRSGNRKIGYRKFRLRSGSRRLVKRFSGALFSWLFVGGLFRAFLAADQIDS